MHQQTRLRYAYQISRQYNICASITCKNLSIFRNFKLNKSVTKSFGSQKNLKYVNTKRFTLKATNELLANLQNFNSRKKEIESESIWEPTNLTFIILRPCITTKDRVQKVSLKSHNKGKSGCTTIQLYCSKICVDSFFRI